MNIKIDPIVLLALQWAQAQGWHSVRVFIYSTQLIFLLHGKGFKFVELIMDDIHDPVSRR